MYNGDAWPTEVDQMVEAGIK